MKITNKNTQLGGQETAISVGAASWPRKGVYVYIYIYQNIHREITPRADSGLSQCQPATGSMSRSEINALGYATAPPTCLLVGAADE